MMKRGLGRVAALTLVAVASWAQAGYELLPQASSVQFVSIKKNSVPELGQFTGLKGSVSDAGAVTVRVELNSVDTAIGIRDERMREWLFQTEQFPEAVFTAQLDESAMVQLAAGESRLVEVAGQLDFHGYQVPVETQLELIGTAQGDVRVHSAEPVLLKAADYGLGSGIEKLKELAGLPSITAAVPVSFTLTFRPVNP